MPEDQDTVFCEDVSTVKITETILKNIFRIFPVLSVHTNRCVLKRRRKVCSDAPGR